MVSAIAYAGGGYLYEVDILDILPIEEIQIQEFIATAGLSLEYFYAVETDLLGSARMHHLHKYFFAAEKDAMIFKLRWA